MTGETESPKSNVRSELTSAEWFLLIILSAIYFTHILDFMIVMPLGPSLIPELSISAREFSFLVAAYGFSAGIAGFVVAPWLDRFDRKLGLLVLYGGFTLGTVSCGLAPDYGLLMTARIAAGAFGGVVVANILAIIGDVFPDVRRGRATAIVMTSFSLAACMGLPAGLQLAEWFGWRAPFLLLGGAGAAVLALASWQLPSLRGHVAAAREAPVSMREVLVHPDHLRAFALSISLVMASFFVAPQLPNYLVFNVKLPKENLIWVYLIGGLVTIGTMTWAGRLADRHDKRGVFAWLALATILPFLIVTHLPPSSLITIILVTTLMMVLSSARMVPAMALITTSSVPRYRGSFMSINSSMQQIAMGLVTAVSAFFLIEHEDKSLEGYGRLGWLACGMTAFSIFFALRIKGVPGGTIAVDTADPATAASEATEPILTATH